MPIESNIKKMISAASKSSGAIDIGRYPTVERANARLMKIMFCLGGLGVVLPFLLPESAWLVDSFPIQWLSGWIPSAHKLASVAQAPNVVHAYIVIMLTLAFIFGMGHFLFLESHREYLLASITKNAPRGRLNLWFKALLGIFVFAALLAFFYVFPGQPTGDPQGSRGQLIVSLMVMTKTGLAIFGSIASAAVTIAWFVWCFVIYTFFCISFVDSLKR